MENLMENYKKYITHEFDHHTGNGNKRIIYKFDNSFGISFIHWNQITDTDIVLDGLSKAHDMTNFGKGGACEIILIKYGDHHSQDWEICYIKDTPFKDAVRHLAYSELPELFDMAMNFDKNIEVSDDCVY